jgi:hypothetical protein
MKQKTRRECVVGVVGLAIASASGATFLLHSDLPSSTHAAIEALRVAVLSLRRITGQSHIDDRIAYIERLARHLGTLGITKITPEQTCDRACNHWLKTTQDSYTLTPNNKNRDIM